SLREVSQIASLSRSGRPKVSRPTSPAHSSTKSAAVSKQAKAATSAFARSISQSPSLPLSTEATATAAEQRGRRQMRGTFLIQADRLRPDPAQPRKAVQDETLDELAASIGRLGLLQPIAVRYIREADIYQIISGERRYHAAK